MEYLFDRRGQVRKVFLKSKNRAALIDGYYCDYRLTRCFIFMGRIRQSLGQRRNRDDVGTRAKMAMVPLNLIINKLVRLKPSRSLQNVLPE
ncbi:hypothetical protein BJV78DRAFT_1222691, partial [Lactifluus subvellereus]